MKLANDRNRRCSSGQVVQRIKLRINPSLAELENREANGVLLASGDTMAGYELLLRDGVLEYTYVYTRGNKVTLRANRAAGTGRHLLELIGRKTGATSGRVEMRLDGESFCN